MRACLCLLVIAACSEQSSKLDRAFDADHANASALDPWGTISSGSKGLTDDDKDKGFDLAGLLARIKETLDKPGPYEAPEQSADFDATKPHWGVIKLGGGVVERQAFSFSLSGGSGGTELRDLVGRLRSLAKDDQLTGLLLRVDSIEISLPDVVELHAAMHDFRKAGKQLHCHTEAAANATYLVLAACDRIGLAPLGEIMIPGPAAMPIHLKGLLDKLGVQADFLHVGAYKGAAEPLTRDAPSKEMLETLNAILDRRYETMTQTIASERKLSPDAVRTMIDTALFPAAAAVQAKLVDEVTTWEAFRDGVKQQWTKLEIEPDDNNQLAAMMKIARFMGAMPPERPTGPHVAVVYALGNIVDGKGEGVLGARQEIASHTMVAALRALAQDDSVRAVVLRIDSGGGSAQASELIWNEVKALKQKKPVLVSMSDVAASGGYYIASGATKIFALEDTLTGSIGVVGGKLAPAGALAKVGVTTFPIGRGKRATLLASLSPWTADERAVIQANMEAIYNVFVSRVAEGRSMKAETVQPIAQGRVWTGHKAKELGLVDEIGGLDAALEEARKLAKLDDTSDVEVYPPSPTLRDVLQRFGNVQSPVGLRAEAHELLGQLDPQLARATEDLVDLALSFGSTHIQALAILPVLR